MADQDGQFREVNAEQVNIVDPDGQVRMTLSNAQRFPDAVIDGRSIPGREASDDTAGVLFYNEDGDECGGLVFTNRGAFLGFDQYKQDQVIGLTYDEDENGNRHYGLFINDQPNEPLLEADGRAMHIPRMFAGRDRDGGVGMTLHDAQGQARVRVRIDATDQPVLEVLGETGEVIRRDPLDTLDEIGE